MLNHLIMLIRSLPSEISADIGSLPGSLDPKINENSSELP